MKAANSNESESWHCWSSNGRWIVYASKRRDNLFGKIYLSYVDEKGTDHKPILLPQEDPTFYDSLLQTYNAPELASSRIPWEPKDFEEGILSSEEGRGADAVSAATAKAMQGLRNMQKAGPPGMYGNRPQSPAGDR